MKGRQLLITFVLVFAAVMAFNVLFRKDEPKESQAPMTQPAATQPAGMDTAGSSSATSQPARIQASRKVYPQIEPSSARLGSLDRKSGFLMEVTLTSQLAAVESAKLTEYFETVNDKRLYNRLEGDQAAYQAEAAKDPETYQGHYAPVHAVSYQGNDYLPYGTSAAVVHFQGVDNGFVFDQEREWTLIESKTDGDEHSATFEWLVRFDKRDDDPKAEPLWVNVLKVRKTFTLKKNSYSLLIKEEVVSLHGLNLRVQLQHIGPVGLESLGGGGSTAMAKRPMDFVLVMKDQKDKFQRTDYGKEDLDKTDMYGVRQDVGKVQSDSPVVWLANVNKYFASILYLQPEDSEAILPMEYDAEYYLTRVQREQYVSGGTSGRMWLPQMDLTTSLKPASQDGSALAFTVNAFIGPKDTGLFEEDPLYKKLDYNDTIISSGCFCLITPVRDGLMWMLNIFAKYLFFGNYGLAIMLLVVIVRIILHPLTKKGQVSMSKMQKKMAVLKPETERIKKQYANDKQRMNQEIMALYKQNGNPMSGMLGCLPMLLQMPIWIALFNGLNTNVNLRHAAFLPFWITDLAAPDHLIDLGQSYFLVGQYINLLPLLVAAAMFAQMKLNPSMASGGAAASPEVEAQQKMMKWLMPVMMLFFFYHMPSGLNLYIMASTTASVCEQYFIRKHIREREEAEEAAETVVQVTGKAPRGSRAKKPKGPMWHKR